MPAGTPDEPKDSLQGLGVEMYGGESTRKQEGFMVRMLTAGKLDK
jgi:hypothetical protein